MSLDDFLDRCKKKGAIPLNYRRRTRYVNGEESTESFENPGFAGLESRAYGKNRGRMDDLLSGMCGEDVVIHDKNGYHYGRLKGYDGKSFYLDRYLFSSKPMGFWDYLDVSFWNKEAMVPAGNVVSMGKIPSEVKEQEEAEHVSIYL